MEGHRRQVSTDEQGRDPYGTMVASQRTTQPEEEEGSTRFALAHSLIHLFKAPRPPRTGHPHGATTLPLPLFIVAILVSVIFGLPHLLIPTVLLPHGAVYTPFAPFGASALVWDETVLYAPQANYTARTLRPPYDAGTYEYRDRPTVVATVPYYMLAPIQWLTGSVGRAFIVADFLFPALAFIFATAIMRRLDTGATVAAAAALLMLIPAQAPRNSLDVVKDLISWRWTTVQPLEYSRFPAPEFSFTLLLAGLLFLLGARRSRWQALAAGLLGGLMFYTYLYIWTVWVAGCALLLVWRTLADRRLNTNLVVVNAITWLASGPFWLTYWRFLRSPAYEAVTHRMSWTIGHLPDRETMVTTALCLTAVLIGWRLSQENENIRLLLVIILGGLVTYNGQLVLGRTFESFHLSNRFFQPMFALVGGGAVGVWARQRWPAWTKHFALLVVVVLLALGAARQVGVSIYTAPLHMLNPGSTSLFEWLRTNGRPNEVVATSEESLNYVLPDYTQQFAYLPFCILSSASDSELAERFLIVLKLLGYDVGFMMHELARPSSDTARQINLSWSFHLFRKHRLEDSEISVLREHWEDITFPRELHRYRIDYVLRSPRDPATQQSLETKGLRRVAEGPFGELYRPR
jgi:hypothetical protein